MADRLRKLDILAAASSGTAVDKLYEKLRLLTDDGGYASELINKTGAASVKGTIVSASTSNDNAFIVTTADSQQPMGIVYDDGIPDGGLCRIISAGTAYVLIKDATTATRGYWVKVSDDTAGRADATNAAPPGGTVGALEDHMSEIGHCLESQGSGTDVLVFCLLHLN